MDYCFTKTDIVTAMVKSTKKNSCIELVKLSIYCLDNDRTSPVYIYTCNSIKDGESPTDRYIRYEVYIYKMMRLYINEYLYMVYAGIDCF